MPSSLLPGRRSVRELLTHAKDAAELTVDLAYASVFFGDHALGREVRRLEQVLDDDLADLRERCMLAARTPEDAAGLAGVLELASAIEEIADAAEDIATVTLRGLGVPGELRDDLRHAAEIVARVKVRDDADLTGRPLARVELPARSGMWIIALRRGDEFLYGPGGDTTLQVGDVLFLQGPADGVDVVRALAGGTPHQLPPPTEHPRLSELDRAVDLCVDLKDASEVAVGLAYSAILLRDRALADEVAAIEARTDQLWADLEGWALEAAAEADDPHTLRGLFHIAAAAERIADAARAMTRLVDSDEPPHPVVAQALGEADEVVADAFVAARSEADGRTVAELALHTTTGMEVLAIQQARRWVYRPRPSRRLAADDRLLTLGPHEGVDRLRELCGDARPSDELVTVPRNED